MTTADLLYVETLGTNCSVGGNHGTVRGLLRRTPSKIDAVFVRMDHPATGAQDGGDMLLVTVNPVPIGDRGQWRSVQRWRRIDRPEFDRLNEIDQLRRDLGWL